MDLKVLLSVYRESIQKVPVCRLSVVSMSSKLSAYQEKVSPKCRLKMSGNLPRISGKCRQHVGKMSSRQNTSN